MGMMFRFKSVQPMILVILVCILLAGCVGTAPAKNATALAAAQTSCSSHADNFYQANDNAIGIQNEKARLFAANIYGLYSANKDNLGLARNQAIDFLAYETERWSHVEDIRVDETNRVWVVMTFISPELIRAVLLNHVLFNAWQSPNTNLSLDEFSNDTFSALEKQKRYLFMITIQPETGDEFPASIEIPSSQVVLINNSGLRVNVIANESFLDQNFDFSSGPRAGFFSYPFGKSEGGECHHVLDPSMDTIITLSLEAKFGGTKKTITWEIPFAPPLPVAVSIPVSNALDLTDKDRMPLKDKDLPNIDLGQSEDPAFWRDFGRFVWGKLTFDPFALH
jgi:hypothetical protein